jgi:hypothetical protein
MSRGDPTPPPADLAERDLGDRIRLLRGAYWRFSHRNAPLIDWSDGAGARFSNPDLPCKVLYLAPFKVTAFWERFGEDLRDQDLTTRAISERILADRVWKAVRVKTGLRIVDLTDNPTLRYLGADGATFFAAYEFTQRWAGALMSHPAAIDGIVYGSRLNPPKKCVALFERAHSATALKISVRPPLPLDDPVILRILARERIRLV